MTYTRDSMVAIMVQDLDILLDRIEYHFKGANRDLIIQHRLELKRALAQLERLVKTLDIATRNLQEKENAADHS